MDKTRRKYDKQFKLDTLEYVQKGDKSISQIAKELGIHKDLIYRWKTEFKQDNKHVFSGQGNPSDKEIDRLKKENRELQIERDILKKALAIFSKPGNGNIDL